MLALLAPFRLRILFRGAFLALAAATIAMALYVLREEKQQSLDNYQDSFRKTKDQIAARLRHPTGQLALLNPHSGNRPATPLHPLLLPYSSLDFDDQTKVRHAIEMAGCLVQYPKDGAVCVAVGSNPWAGGFIYVAGRFLSDDLVPHPVGERHFDAAHRLRVQVDLRGQHYRWIAPFESANPDALPGKVRQGRLTGFVENASGDYVNARPVKDFRGWIWQSSTCAGASTGQTCEHAAFFSIRLPVEVLRDALFAQNEPEWPPADLDDIQVHLEALAPHSAAAFFDSNNGEARAPFLLSDLQALLLPGESLRIHKPSDPPAVDVLRMTGPEATVDESWKIIYWLIRKLPVDDHAFAAEARETIVTPLGPYELTVNGDVRSANKLLARAATRVSWFVAAMLLALFTAWFVIEVGIIRRIARLTRRATSVSRTVKGSGGATLPDLADLRGSDELGILASCLHDLLRRVAEDVEREKIRAEQEKDMWHAVGHEIMSPLQSLMALHGDPANPASRYIHRMQQAVRVLYGSASPSEAFQTTRLQLAAIDLNAFLTDVARNAPCAGIDTVHFTPGPDPVMVRAEEYALEDVVTHVLRNADRHRVPGTPISLRLERTDTTVLLTLHNQGQPIPEELIGKIFEYGVSDQSDSAANGNRGQGLFVAKTYMAKMGGTITAHNTADGVEFVLSLLRAPA